MAKVRLLYEYRGLKAIPSEWFEGEVLKYRYEECWYWGSEIVDETTANDRVKELEVIVNDYGNKKYRNIQIIRQ